MQAAEVASTTRELQLPREDELANADPWSILPDLRPFLGRRVRITIEEGSQPALATAAPVLLAAVENALGCLESLPESAYGLDVEELADELRAAIAKAKGGA